MQLAEWQDREHSSGVDHCILQKMGSDQNTFLPLASLILVPPDAQVSVTQKH